MTMINLYLSVAAFLTVAGCGLLTMAAWPKLKAALAKLLGDGPAQMLLQFAITSVIAAEQKYSANRDYNDAKKEFALFALRGFLAFAGKVLDDVSLEALIEHALIATRDQRRESQAGR